MRAYKSDTWTQGDAAFIASVERLAATVYQPDAALPEAARILADVEPSRRGFVDGYCTAAFLRQTLTMPQIGEALRESLAAFVADGDGAGGARC